MGFHRFSHLNKLGRWRNAFGFFLFNKYCMTKIQIHINTFSKIFLFIIPKINSPFNIISIDIFIFSTIKKYNINKLWW